MYLYYHTVDSEKDQGEFGKGKKGRIETDEYKVEDFGGYLVIKVKDERKYSDTKYTTQRATIGLYPADLVKIVNMSLARAQIVRKPTKKLTEAKKLLRQAAKLIDEDSPTPKKVTAKTVASNGKR